LSNGEEFYPISNVIDMFINSEMAIYHILLQNGFLQAILVFDISEHPPLLSMSQSAAEYGICAA
jgi:hypothetical protein